MEREPVVGECVVVTQNTGDHGSRVGDRLIVCHVDENDDTIRGIPAGLSTVTDYWIPWSAIEPVTFGWEYAREHLPADVVALLSACDGIETLSLNRYVKDAIFASLPDWRERVLEVLQSMNLDHA